jgi:hypothetical protein
VVEPVADAVIAALVAASVAFAHVVNASEPAAVAVTVHVIVVVPPAASVATGGGEVTTVAAPVPPIASVHAVTFAAAS